MSDPDPLQRLSKAKFLKDGREMSEQELRAFEDLLNQVRSGAVEISDFDPEMRELVHQVLETTAPLVDVLRTRRLLQP